MKKGKNLNVWLAMSMFLLAMVSTVSGKIIFVEADANGANDGSSWTNAYNYLQDALTAASGGDEIWVAEGIYKPDQGIGITPGDRTVTFQLINGVTLKGGYAGFGEPDPNTRYIDLYETILTGDLNGDDIQVADPCELLGDPTRAENSYHVITGSGTDETAVLDGFTVTGGNANRSWEYYRSDRGAGMYNDSSSPTLTNCIFSGNSASRGGGMTNYRSSPTLTNCTIIANLASGPGGGMYNYSGSPTITKCVISSNSARDNGGGIYNISANPTLTNCTFSDNSANSDGGGMYNLFSNPMLTNCTFSVNSANSDGGGMYNAIKSPKVVACMFSGNSSGGYGGGMCNATSSPILTNCAFTNNSAENGGGVYNVEDKGVAGFKPSDPTLTNCTFTGNSARYGGGIFNTDESSPILTNCILWDDTSNEITDEFGCVTLITYSNVQGGWPGEGNIDADPALAFSNDPHITSGSPCIDAGINTPDVNLTTTDIDGNPRILDGNGDGTAIVDMGAYEYNPNSPSIAIAASDFIFSHVRGQPNPAPQTLLIRNRSGETLNWEIIEDCNWLQIYPANGVSTGQINEVTLSVDISGLAPGSYDCQLTIAAEGALNSPQTVAVTLNLGGSELYVPSEYGTIQEAIDAAIDGDVVIIAPDTYTGPGNRDIDFGGKAITVRSIDPNDPNIVAATIIDCNGTRTDPHRGFYFHSGEDANSILSGLTIANGHARCGGGIYCVSSSPTITNCVFRDNKAQYYSYIWTDPAQENRGSEIINDTDANIKCPVPPPQRRGNGAGFCCVDSNTTLTNCKFNGNSAYEQGGGMYSSGGNPTLINCIFNANLAGAGGGMANLLGSCPTLTNCTFTANSAEYGGGGIRNGDNSNPTLTNCSFSANSAGWSGGIGNYLSSPTLTNCTFSGNSADEDGGGMNNYESNPVLTDCIFSGNSANRGGGIFSEKNSGSTLTNSTFNGNAAYQGGGIHCVSSSPTITNCTFSDNKAEFSGPPPPDPPPLPPENNSPMVNDDTGIHIDCPPLLSQWMVNGGGIYCIDSNAILTNCEFRGNSAYDYGGGMYNYRSSPTLINCTFSGNSSASGGGMESQQGSSPTLTNCTFTVNIAEYGGGGMRNSDHSNPTLTNCTFSGNSAGWSGGIGNYLSSPTLTNCTFSGNSANSYGGGMNNGYLCSPMLKNCTFSGNSASASGGGIYCENIPYPPPPDPIPASEFALLLPRVLLEPDVHLIIVNCILWDNEAPSGPQIYLGHDSNALLSYSDVQGGDAGVHVETGSTLNWGEGNIDADPSFVQLGYWDANGVWVEGDYHLLPDSPCINAGDPNYIAEPNETDLDGRPRVLLGRIDMGAYEFNHIPVADAGVDQTVYAWIDGIAEVTLDGTGSYDDDGQPLTYLWSWTINGQTYDVNGVTPTIELTAGEQTIELIVNDGIEDSEPDDVVITVVPPMESHLRIAPRVINHRSRQPRILALLRLPQGVTADQIDSDEPLLLYPGGIEAIRQRVIESRRRGAQHTSILALFNKAELMDAVSDNGEVELQVVGNLKTGQYFYGTDTVRVISPRNDDNGNGRPRRRGHRR